MREARSFEVSLVYLARLRDAFGAVGETLSLQAANRATVACVLDALRERGGVWAAELAPGRAVRFAVNHEMARLETEIAPGDEVALFPPVTGG